MPVKLGSAIPSPAATLVLVRDHAGHPVSGAGGRAIELLLIQRHRASRFAAGDFVFPGGRVEADDNPSDAAAWCAGLDVERAAARLGLADAPHTALGYWIGAIRETFEEVGILLAYDAEGRPAQPRRPRFEKYRRACHADNRAFWDMLRAERLTLATDRLFYFAHWITPEEQPIRFDTRFFAAAMPTGQEAVPDEHEITAVRWLSPSDALAAGARGDLPLRFPTLTNLRLFDGADDAADALARLQGRAVVAIMPRVVVENGARTVLLPGDPGY